MATNATVKDRPTTRHPVDEVLPIPKLAVYGFQHVLAFYAGAVIVPILLANSIGLTTDQLIHLINADLFTCGIASIIQSVGFWKVGVRLPLLQGVTFTAVSPMIAIGLANGGGTEGLLVIYGAVIVAGLFTFLIAPFFSKLIRFFPPVVTGTVITIIGIALLPVAAADAAGGAGPDIRPNQRPEHGLRARDARPHRDHPAGVQGLHGHRRRPRRPGRRDARGLRAGRRALRRRRHSPWLGVTTPFYFGWPKFAFAAILSMIVVMLITAVETTGDVFATGEIVEKRIGKDDIARALRADGLATTLGGILNSFPYTCFAENVGLVRLTRIKSRYVVAAAGAIMIILGLLPKAAAIVAGIPHPVLGGAALAMFATVAVVGIQTLTRVDFHDHRNVVIVATSLGLAMYVTAVPDVAKAVPDWAEIIFGSGITLGSLTAILLNLVFHHLGKNYGPAVAGTPGAAIRLDQVNAMSREEFIRTFSGLFQGPDWVVERAYDQRPFSDTHDLRRAFQEALFAASTDEQEQLINSYPDLGARSVVTGEEGAASLADQSALGLNRLAEKEHQELASLTAAYRDRFGFPLVTAVRDNESFNQVLRHGWERLNNSPTQEHTTAVIEIAKIATHRFDQLVADANPIHSARVPHLDN